MYVCMVRTYVHTCGSEYRRFRSDLYIESNGDKFFSQHFKENTFLVCSMNSVGYYYINYGNNI